MTDIDENIRPLVYVLDSMPGIWTSSSCGGHENPEKGQAKAGEWYACFGLVEKDGRPTRDAWRSLTLITEAAITIFADLVCWYDGTLLFELRGRGESDKLVKILEKWKA